MQFLKREAVLLALLPALGMVGVYAYESGRYRYLKVPSMLIDLPLNRLLMGGVAIAVLMTCILMMIGLLLKRMAGRSKFSRFLTLYVVFFILLGLPPLLYASTLSGVISAFVLPTCLAIAGFITPKDEKKPSAGEDRSALPWLSDAIFFALTALSTSWLIGGFGYWTEKSGVVRVCQENQLVAGLYRDNLIVKSLPKSGAELGDEVRLVPAAGALLQECSPTFIGGRGISVGEENPKEKLRSSPSRELK